MSSLAASPECVWDLGRGVGVSIWLGVGAIGRLLFLDSIVLVFLWPFESWTVCTYNES